MGIRRGTATPTKIYRGTTPVKKVMRGTVEVWADSPYPLSGSWGPYSGYGGVRDNHSILEDGVFRITHTLTVISGTGGGYRQAMITASGQSVEGPNANVSTATGIWTLAKGLRVEFRSVTGQGTINATGTWTIEKIG